MTYKFIRYQKEGRLVTITIDRPDVKNTIHGQSGEELVHAWKTFREDDDAWCAILTGAGDEWFSDGRELRWIVATYMSGGAPKKNEALAGAGGVALAADRRPWSAVTPGQ